MTRMGRPAEGLEYIKHGIELSPRDSLMSYWVSFLGEAELELGHNDSAIEHFQHSLSLNPGLPRVWSALPRHTRYLAI